LSNIFGKASADDSTIVVKRITNIAVSLDIFEEQYETNSTMKARLFAIFIFKEIGFTSYDIHYLKMEICSNRIKLTEW
jgi:hypothetical protein